eukprot:scaffold199808_cov48-Prasinocladus_malaysianus.AAC.1
MSLSVAVARSSHSGTRSSLLPSRAADSFLWSDASRPNGRQSVQPAASPRPGEANSEHTTAGLLSNTYKIPEGISVRGFEAHETQEDDVAASPSRRNGLRNGHAVQQIRQSPVRVQERQRNSPEQSEAARKRWKRAIRHAVWKARRKEILRLTKRTVVSYFQSMSMSAVISVLVWVFEGDHLYEQAKEPFHYAEKAVGKWFCSFTAA